MKNLVILAIVVGFAGLTACSDVDSKLVQKMEESVASVEQVKPVAENLNQDLEQMKARLSNVPEESKVAVEMAAGQFAAKIGRMTEEYNKTQEEILQLKSDYSEGKISKEEAEKYMAALNERISNFQKGIEKVKERMNADPETLIQFGNEVAKNMNVNTNQPVSQDVTGTPDKVSADQQAQPRADGQSLTAPAGMKKGGN